MADLARVAKVSMMTVLSVTLNLRHVDDLNVTKRVDVSAILLVNWNILCQLDIWYKARLHYVACTVRGSRQDQIHIKN